MAIIGNEINGVKIKFAPAVNREVDPRTIEGLRRAIRADIAEGHVLKEIYLSPANDQHDLPNNQVQGGGKAVDISRINGMNMSVYYATSKSVKAIVDAIQTAFEGYPHRRENLGPSLRKKLGAAVSIDIDGHRDHVRLSVN